MADLDELVQAFEDMGENIKILCNAWVNIIEKAFKQIPLCLHGKKRVSYNSKYWKITDDNTLNIKLMVQTFGSNGKSYYLMKEG